ncbi:zinc finger, CCHC-type containing protein, partial [Tanacetum coccineum]
MSGVAKHLDVVVIQQQNGLVKEMNVTLLAKVRCFLNQSGLSKVFWAEDTTMSTYLVTRSPSSATGFKSPIDMLGFFGWLASIKQGILEPVKVKCIFLGYRKGVVGNKALKVLQGDEFEVEPQNDHTFEVEPHGNVDHVVGSQEVQTQDLIYYQLARDREQHLACELFGYREDSNEAAFAVAAVEKLYAHESLTFNDTVACEVISKWKAGLKDDMDTRSDVYVLSNVGSQEYQMVCTRLDIASADVGMLDKFDRGLQTDVQVFVDFDYAMAAYMTLTGSWKKKIWLKGLMAESGYELSLVAGIAIGALVKGSSRSEVSAQVEGAAYREGELRRWWMRSSEEEFNPIDILTYSKELFLGEDATRAIPNMSFNLVNVEGFLYLEIEVVCVEFGYHFEEELECEQH